MAINWSLSTSDGSRTIAVFLADTTSKTVSDNHPNFDKVLEVLMRPAGNATDEEISEELLGLLDVATTVATKLQRLSERITTDMNNIMFDGDIIDSAVSDYLIKALRRDVLVASGETIDTAYEAPEETSWQAIVNFMEKLYQNPSDESIEHLYSFISRYGLTIRPNGDFVAFKGLNEDYTSIHSGPGIVNGSSFSKANLDNTPGNVVEIARSKVETSREHGCASGLHVGSFNYASGFSRGKVVTVCVNPRDVVSVPSDCAYQKVRVSRYEVLADIPGNYTHSQDTFLWDDEEDDDCREEEEYCESCGECLYDHCSCCDDYYDEDGYDEDGYDPVGYDRDGYDRTGYDRDGYDHRGYDHYGVFKDGYSQSSASEGGSTDDEPSNGETSTTFFDKVSEIMGEIEDNVKDRLEQLRENEELKNLKGWAGDLYFTSRNAQSSKNVPVNILDFLNDEETVKKIFNLPGSALPTGEKFNNIVSDLVDKIHSFGQEGDHDGKHVKTEHGGNAGDIEYDSDGYDREGFNKAGYDRNGYDRSGYDSRGFDRHGVNSDGYDENGVYVR